MSEREDRDTSQEEWLGGKWSTWGCLALVGSLAIAWLAIVTALYGIFTIPSAFGPPGFLSPDPRLIPPFTPPAEEDVFIGIPPIGVAEFTTGQPLLLNDGVLFTVARSSRDWDPQPPQTPQVEYSVVEVRLQNEGPDALTFSPQQFRMETPWAWEGPFEPVTDLPVPNLLEETEVQAGDSVQGILVFARPDVREVRRYLVYEPPFRDEAVRVLLVP